MPQADFLDRITADDIHAALPESLKTLPIFWHETLDSTNTEAKRMLSRGFDRDAIVTASMQTGGRGRLGRSFYSPADTGIYVSYLLHPEGELSDLVSLTAAAAVAVDRAIRKLTDAEPLIKWVNDLYLDGKKICGILAETVTRPQLNAPTAIIIGIGLNMNMEAFPKELQDIAGSLHAPKIKKSRMIAAIAEELFALAKDPSDRSYMEEYRAHSLVLGKRVICIRGDVKTHALAIGIDDDGGLRVQLDDGSEQTLHTGEITLRLDS